MLSAQIAECLEGARRCRELANRAANSDRKEDFLRAERRWLRLAESVKRTGAQTISSLRRIGGERQVFRPIMKFEGLAERMIPRIKRVH